MVYIFAAYSFNNMPPSDLAYNIYKNKIIRHLFNKWGNVQAKSGYDNNLTNAVQSTTVTFDFSKRTNTDGVTERVSTYRDATSRYQCSVWLITLYKSVTY